jgi:hypothetical protein
MSNPIDAPGHTFQLATLRKTNQDRILYAGGARLIEISCGHRWFALR